MFSKRFLSFLCVFSLFVNVKYAKSKLLEEPILRLGDVMMVIVPTLAFGKTFYQNDIAGIKYYLYNFVVVNLGTSLLQLVVKEERPNRDGSYKSFPSGHASAAFSGATYVHFRYSFDEAKWLYLAASFVAFSRIYGRKHHFHDVLASAALSYLSSYILVKNKNKNKIYSVSYNPDNNGIYMDFRYFF